MRPAWRRRQRIERRKALRRHLREERDAVRAEKDRDYRFTLAIRRSQRAVEALFRCFRRSTFTFHETALALGAFGQSLTRCTDPDHHVSTLGDPD